MADNDEFVAAPSGNIGYGEDSHLSKGSSMQDRWANVMLATE